MVVSTASVIDSNTGTCSRNAKSAKYIRPRL